MIPNRKTSIHTIRIAVIAALAIVTLHVVHETSADESLIAHWSMDEVTDGKIKDQSGFQNDAMIKGKLTLEEGRSGKAVRFDGSGNSYLVVNPSRSLDYLTEFTIEGWIKYGSLYALEGERDNYPTFLNRGAYDKDYPSIWIFSGFHSKNQSSYKKICNWYKKPDWPNVWGAYSQTLEWQKDRWYHLKVAVNAEQESITYFRDGTEVGSSGIPPDYSFSTGPIYIGSYQGIKGTGDMNGLLNEVKIHDESLAKVAHTVTKAVKIARPPVIDGELSDEAWKGASSVTDFRLHTRETTSASVQTTARMTYDDENLYFGFEISEQDIKTIVAACTNHDAIWGDDCIEIFLDPGNTRKSYFHFGINAIGNRAEEKNREILQRDWNVDWSAATRKGNHSWTVEARIPFKSLELQGPPKDGDKWGISLNRSKNNPQENSGWPNGYFHRADKFGKLVFGSYKTNLERQVQESRQIQTELENLLLEARELDIGEQPQVAAQFAGKELKKVAEELTQVSNDLSSKEWCVFQRGLNALSNQLNKSFFLVKGNVLLKKLGERHAKLSKSEKKTFLLEMLELQKRCPSNLMTSKEKETLSKLTSQYWRTLSGRPYLCWKKNPWLDLPANQFPNISDDPFSEIEINLVMGVNEYESASFVLTNFTTNEIQCVVKTPPKNKIPLVIREACIVKAADGTAVNDALPLHEKLVIPSLESREVWLTFHTLGVQAGEYSSRLMVQVDEQKAFPVELKVKVYPVGIPDNPKEIPVYTYAWDYLNNWGELQSEAKADLLAHYITVPFLNQGAVPWPTYDKEGRAHVEYGNLDKALKLWEDNRQTKMLGIWWNFHDFDYLGSQLYFGKQDEYMTPPWKQKFADWLRQLVSRLKERGLRYDDFCFHVFDETSSAKVKDFFEFMKSIDPQAKLFLNPCELPGGIERQIKEVSPYVDVWSPWLVTYGGQREILETMRVKGEFFWLYNNPSSLLYKLAPPYAHYRLTFWRAWQLGAHGCGVWAYSINPDRAWTENERKNPCQDLVYWSQYAPPGVSRMEAIIPSKRWEAWREGVEDYCYLDRLNTLIQDSKVSSQADRTTMTRAKMILNEWPEKVIRQNDNPALADEAKREILEMICRLKI